MWAMNRAMSNFTEYIYSPLILTDNSATPMFDPRLTNPTFVHSGRHQLRDPTRYHPY